MWQKEAEKEPEPEKKVGGALDNTITDEIKEEEQEGSEGSDDEAEKTKIDSPMGSISNADNSILNNPEGDDAAEETFMSLDEAIEAETHFDINKVSKLDQRLKDVNR